MKIFVVGGAGYIGSICAEVLLDEGHEVVIFDNLSEGHRLAVDTRAQFVRGDLEDHAAVQTALSNSKPDAVMHFAASALVSESMTNPSKYFRNNVANGLNLLDAMIATDVKKIVFSSTCAIFKPPGDQPIDEDLPKGPINPYGESKLAFEQILRWYDQIHGLKFVSLIPNVLKVALGQKESVEIYGTDYETPDGTCIRDYIHIIDLARAHILALKSPKSEFYNLGTGGGSSVREVIDVAQKVIGKRLNVAERPRRAGDPPRLIAASKKIKRELGWEPQFQSLEAIIRSAWNWHQKFPRGYED
jgi:UDP-glucose 4-epimerase